ncbi:hypothetical protein GALL_279060 [mine drainage metagenome]|uniref:Uncharacterized protein n=1 Tax=mine drainage metagenome TaxID=410659 RepID=A0A1J5RQ13_9ZZZZ
MTKSSAVLLRLEKGELVNYNGQEYVVLKVIDLNKVLARSMISKNTDVLEIRHLTPWVVKQDDTPAKPDIDLTEILEEEWRFARERLKCRCRFKTDHLCRLNFDQALL